MEGIQIWILIIAFLLFAAVTSVMEQNRQNKRKLEAFRAGFGKRNDKTIPEEIMQSIREHLSGIAVASVPSTALSDTDMPNAAKLGTDTAMFDTGKTEPSVPNNDIEWFLDDITWNDLELDAIFHSMNRTITSVGQEMLYLMLHRLLKQDDALEEREKKMLYFTDMPKVREEIQMKLSLVGKLPRRSAAEVLLSLKEAPSFSRIPHIMMACLFFATALGAILGMFFPNVPESLFFATLPAVAIFNILQYYKHKGTLDRYLPAFRYVFRLAYAGGEIASLLQKSQKDATLGRDAASEKDATPERNAEPERDATSEKDSASKSGAELESNAIWEAELKKLSAALKRVKRISRQSWLVMSGQSMSGNLIDMLLDYVRMTLHLDLIQFSGMLTSLQKEYDEIIKLYEVLGEIDALIAMASYRVYLSGISECCIPEFYGRGGDVGSSDERNSMENTADYKKCNRHNSDGKEHHKRNKLVIHDVFHPMLETPVTNSFETASGILVTGSNASGKSTFLKSVALCGIFAQTLHFCPASCYQAPLYSVMTSMALRDHLDCGESYYVVETRSLKRIMDGAKEFPPVLIVIDEILRGTNTVERIASSSHILKALNELDAMVLAATHDIELADIMAKYYENFHFQEQISQNEITFDYKLYSGKAVSRNAIRLLEQMGFDRRVTKEAERMAQKFEAENIWESF